MLKIMEFERVEKLKSMAAEKIYYYVLNLAYIFHFSSWYYCLCERFQGCVFKNGEDLYCFICRFKMEYNPKDIEEIKCTKKIENIYLAMKEDLKKSINFDQSIDNFWLHNFKINWVNNQGEKR